MRELRLDMEALGSAPTLKSPRVPTQVSYGQPGTSSRYPSMSKLVPFSQMFEGTSEVPTMEYATQGNIAAEWLCISDKCYR